MTSSEVECVVFHWMVELMEDEEGFQLDGLNEKERCPRGGTEFCLFGSLEDCVGKGCLFMNGCIGIELCW